MYVVMLVEMNLDNIVTFFILYAYKVMLNP